MRFRQINFAVAIGVSLGLHALLWPASKRIIVRGGGDDDAATPRATEVTLLLNPDGPPKVDPRRHPKAPEVDPPDEMGQATGKGTGAQPAVGDRTLQAKQADQDQAFLSRDPVGHGRVGDPPAVNTGARGENGVGGQRGGPRTPADPHRPQQQMPPREALAEPAPPAPPMAMKSERAERRNLAEAKPASVAPPDKSDPTPRRETAPPPSEKPSVGAAKTDINQPPVEEKKLTTPLAMAKADATGEIAVSPTEGAPAAVRTANGAAPPIAHAPAELPAVTKAPPSPLPHAPESRPAHPPDQPARPAPPQTQPAKPVFAMATPAPPAPNLVATGDSRAPGVDRPSADPAQESDSESDPFSKEIFAEMRDGRLEVRKGRKVKTVRPHFLPGAIGAFLSNPDPVLVLQISIDPSGIVKNVDVVRSTGSVEIDQPCRVAVYDWWFEPTHDKKGRPVADVLLFTLRFR